MTEEKGIIIAVNKWDAIEKDNNTVKKTYRENPSDLKLYAVCRDFVYFCKVRSASE